MTATNNLLIWKYMIRIIFIFPFILGSCGSDSDKADYTSKIRLDSISQTLRRFTEDESAELIEYGKKLYAQSVQDNDSSGRATAYLYIAEGYYRQRKDDSSLMMFLKAEHLGTELKDSAFLARIYHGKGVLHYHQGMIAKAEKEYLRSLACADAVRDTQMIATNYGSLGTIARDWHEYSKATDYMVKSLALAEMKKYDKDVAIARRDLGIIASESGDSAMAMQNFRIAIEKFKKINDSSGIGEIYIEYAMFYYKSDPELSESYFLKARDLFCQLGLEDMILVVNHNLACLDVERGKYAEARNVFEENYRKTVETKDMEGQAKSLTMLITTAIWLNDFPGAEKYIRAAEELSEIYNQPDFRQDIYTEKIHFYYRKKDFKTTTDLYADYTRFNDSLMDAEKEHIAQSVQQQFIYEKNALELTVLERRTEMQNSRQRMQNILIYSLIGFLIIAVGLIGIILYFYTRNMRFQRKLAEREKQLVEANIAKDKFFSIISHDLRAPFQNILGFSEVLAEDLEQIDKPTIRRYLGNIDKAARHAYQLMDDLLQWSMTQRQGIRPDLQEIDMVECIRRNVQIAELKSVQKKITVETPLPFQMLVKADEKMVDTILRNLLSNALKYTSENGRVEITCIESDGSCLTRVTDTGVGIKPEHIARLFDIAAASSTPGTAKEKGSGLGLILCYEFVKANGGDIRVFSEPGKGTTVEFTLPLANRDIKG